MSSMAITRITGKVVDEEQRPIDQADVVVLGVKRVKCQTTKSGTFEVEVDLVNRQIRVWILVLAGTRIGLKPVVRPNDGPISAGSIEAVPAGAIKHLVNLAIVNALRLTITLSGRPRTTGAICSLLLIIGITSFLFYGETVDGPDLASGVHISEVRVPPSVVRPKEHFVLSPPSRNKTIEVEGSIEVEVNGTLEIRPGVTLLFQKGQGIYSRGTILAKGQQDNRITFGAKNPGDGWGHLALYNPAGEPSVLEWCRFEYGRGSSYKTPNRVRGEAEKYFQRSPNESVVGGGLLVYNVNTLSLQHCDFTHNSAEAGGAIYIRNGSNIRLNTCTFTDNTASTSQRDNAPGGAVFVQTSNPVFSNCTFINNRAIDKFSCGGAIYIGYRAGIEITRSVFQANQSAYVGGALYALNLTEETIQGPQVVRREVTFRDVHFLGNSASAGGGALYFDQGVDGNIIDCCFVGNRIGYKETPFDTSADPNRYFGGAAICIDSEREDNPSLLKIESGAETLGFDGNTVFVADLVPEHSRRPEHTALKVRRNSSYKGPAPEPARVILRSPIVPTAYRKATGLRVVDTVVLHHISAINWFAKDFQESYSNQLTELTKKLDLTPSNLKEHKYSWQLCKKILELYRVSAHYMVLRDGRILQLVRENDVAYHAGRALMPPGDDRQRINDFSVGIELIASHPHLDADVRANPSLAYTEEQYKALEVLLQLIQARYPVTNLVGHDEIAGQRAVEKGIRTRAMMKTDPGPLFDWNRFRSDVGLRDFVHECCGDCPQLSKLLIFE